MGFISGLFKRILKLIFYFVVIAAFIVFIPNLPPYTKFTPIEIEPSQLRVDALAPNNDLNNAEQLFKNKLLGPESFQIWKGEVYTGLATGEIVKVSPGGHVTFVTKIGQPCSLIQEHICGRPLGFEIDDKNNFLYVADAYHGIWKVNLVTDKKQLLVSPRVEINGRKPKLFNSVALDKNGDLYWTDSSSDFYLRDGVMALLVDPAGRLFHYNSAKNESKVLLDDLWFPNGVVISPDNNFIIVAETSKYRLVKYYINGPKKGTSEVFVAGLPGNPDNIRVLPDGSGVLVALYTVFDDENPLLLKTMSKAPLARKFLARIVRLIEIPFEFLQSQFPNHIFEEIVHKIGSFGSVEGMAPEMAGFIHIDWNGKIIASYYNTDGSVKHISDVIVVNNKLYLGCPHLQDFIGAVPAPPQLIKAFITEGSQKPVVDATPQNKPQAREKLEKEKRTTPQPPKQTGTQAPPQQKPTVTQAPPQQKPTVTQAPPQQKPTVTRVPPQQKPTVTQAPPQQKPTVTQTPPQQKPKTQSNENLKENVGKQNVPKEATQKPVEANKQNDTPKSAKQREEIKTKPIIKEEQKVEVKKGSETPKVEPKKTDVKSKSVPQDTKPKETETKDKPKPPEQKPKSKQNEANKKYVDDKKSENIKKQEPETKPIIKEKEDKAKDNVEKTGNKETVSKQTDSKPTIKAPETKDKLKSDTSETKPKKVNPESVKKAPEQAPKVIAIEENIPSDTVMPSRETLKVIKRDGPQEIPNPNQ